MVQNWENFMSPSGGATETPLMTNALASLGASIGVDMLMRPTVDSARNKFAEENYQGKGRKGRIAKRAGYREFIKQQRGLGIERLSGVSIKRGIYSTLDTTFGTGYVVSTSSKNEFRKPFIEKMSKKNPYVGASRLLKGVSWTLMLSGFAMMAESLATPGLTKSAQQSEMRAMGGMGPMDSQQAYTQRQRALMAIHDSQLGLRNVIGNEAGHFHR